MTRLLPVFFIIVLCATGSPAMAQEPVVMPPAVANLQPLLASPMPELAKTNLPTDELNKLYALRNYKPAWNFTTVNDNSVTLAFINSLESTINYHGLTTQNYPLDIMRNLSPTTEEDRAKLDLFITASLLRLAHDLHGDYVNLEGTYLGWNYRRAPVDFVTLLAAALKNGGVNEFIASLAPKDPVYTKLAAALRIYRAFADQGGWKPIDVSKPIEPNQHGPHILQLRARLEAEAYKVTPIGAADFYDESLQKVVTEYQERNGLDADGHATIKTILALNVPVTQRIEQIRANMERWRHIPENFPGERYALVNIASQTIVITEANKEIYSGPVVIGKIHRKTPFIQSNIRSMIINPTWHVPAKIARKDILPKLRQDPHYLEKLGFVIGGNKTDPYGESIDWTKISIHDFNQLHLRQAPGDQNSLGHVKFDFDNEWSVYMHGTPHQDLFERAQRTYSSGCIRLRDPDQIGEILLNGNAGQWTADKIESEVAEGKMRWVGIKNPMPLYVLYWSVFPDPTTGAINFRKDVYGYDNIMTMP